MRSKTMTITTLLLERYLCDEVTAEEKTFIEESCQSDAGLRQRMEAMRESSAAILNEYPPSEMAGMIERGVHLQLTGEKMKTAEAHEALTGFFRAPLRAVVIAVLLFSILPVSFHFLNSGKSESTRIKGKPYLSMYRKAGEGFEKLRNNDPVVAGDTIQVGYVAGGGKYGLIFSVDGTGAITVHFPESTSATGNNGKLMQGGEHLLAESFELDSAPAFERFFLVTSDRPIAVREVLHQCEKQFSRSTFAPSGAPRLDLPETYLQMSFILAKDKQP